MMRGWFLDLGRGLEAIGTALDALPLRHEGTVALGEGRLVA
ncbi:hypothetical protein HRbin27_01468 [bacterium HR27]|nr:hypothetical protein HRbin27_01468 [bacterium HR27]